MELNIGNYLESVIKNSGYTKKELCEELNKRYSINNKPISYTTFSNNLKEGNITLNEALALATIINIDLNKIVNTYKNKYIQINKKQDNSDIKKNIIQILNTELSSEGVVYSEENIYEINDDEYECMYLSKDGNKAIMNTVLLDDYILHGADIGFIVEKANFDNFLDILGECNISINEFREMPLNERLTFLSNEGDSELMILGEERKETEFIASKYLK
ncbi:MAG: hypothetical protein IJ086_16080 [Clostridium sp.]|nr:hypothetical protein [Clostridium sp.]